MEYDLGIIRIEELLTSTGSASGPGLISIGFLQNLHHIVIFPSVASTLSFTLVKQDFSLIGCFVAVYPVIIGKH